MSLDKLGAANFPKTLSCAWVKPPLLGSLKLPGNKNELGENVRKSF